MCLRCCNNEAHLTITPSSPPVHTWSLTAAAAQAACGSGCEGQSACRHTRRSPSVPGPLSASADMNKSAGTDYIIGKHQQVFSSSLLTTHTSALLCQQSKPGQASLALRLLQAQLGLEPQEPRNRSDTCSEHPISILRMRPASSALSPRSQVHSTAHLSSAAFVTRSRQQHSLCHAGKGFSKCMQSSLESAASSNSHTSCQQYQCKIKARSGLPSCWPGQHMTATQ